MSLTIGLDIAKDKIDFYCDQRAAEIKNNAGSTETKGLRKQSMDNDLNFGMLLAGGGYDLTEIMLQLDQTIGKRN